MLRYGLIALSALALWFATGVPTPASALIIDAFTDPAGPTTATVVTPNPAPVNTPAGAFLGSRALEANHTSGALTVVGEIDAGGNSLLNISLGPGTLGNVSVLWSAIPGVDLTEASTKNAIALGIIFDDVPATITLEVTDTSSNFGSASLAAPGGIFSPQTASILFSSFSGSVNFGSVGSIKLIATSSVGGLDLQLDLIESALIIPEPGTALLLGMGLAGLALHRRRAA